MAPLLVYDVCPLAFQEGVFPLQTQRNGLQGVGRRPQGRAFPVSKLILSVSYDEALLRSRHAFLEWGGYKVTSALGFANALDGCKGGAFDLFILGHSIPSADKARLMKAFRSNSASPILSLWQQHEPIVENAEYLAFSDNPDELLRSVGTIFARRAQM